ncbi:MAG: prolipoprotein diacylglyceryl transferase [Rhodospirillales bacterium]|nr:prolipoprotein diacylglyceryl transferase [Rhodospirillales bacterium]
MTFVIPYPRIDPILFEIGPLAIRWYALAYIGGLLLGWRYVRALAKMPPQTVGVRDIDDFLVWATLGVVLGGRIGYVLFYRLDYYLAHPAAVLAVWQGGMSFHGGAVGVLVALFMFARRRGIPFRAFGDVVACATPIGLFLGRVANFINGELIGRATDVPWAMVFPGGGPQPRHPSQLYEAGLEGAVLFVVLYLFARQEWVRRRQGFLGGAFLAGYAVARSIAELFREPDTLMGVFPAGLTYGQMLCIPMLIAGVALMWRAKSGR